ncbi:hypothetical protein SO694_00018233 [Aureococcus anophagefferens]|uniref:Nucleotide-diphospho-sugar transferase domain-containing protein n=1 Tax=Aureococcus anophagefferens TaxID=44056 RepID=A0ABR1G0E7_AURAN
MAAPSRRKKWSFINILLTVLALLIGGVTWLTLSHHRDAVAAQGDRGHGVHRLMGAGADPAELEWEPRVYESETFPPPKPKPPAPLSAKIRGAEKALEAAIAAAKQRIEAAAAPDDGDRSRRVHVVFSTDCTPYQDWQSEVVFNSADVVGHKGPVTRIASGCKDGREEKLRARYAQLYGEHSRFSMHVTPEFNKDEKTGKAYHFYNKPRGIEHFLESGGVDFAGAPIVALIDPDFAFLRPLTDVVERENALLIKPWTKEELPAFVDEGHPVGQQYGLGTHWLTFDREKICGAGSPCLTTDSKDAYKYYPVGPPYVMHHADWRRLAPVWRDFAPKVYAQYPDLLAEMYAYCMAAAHLRLRHARVNHMMLSNVHVQDEGWAHLDARPLEDACPARRYDAPRIVADALDGTAGPAPRLPTFLHYCQNYRLGEYMFAKRRVPPKLFTDCAHPFLEEPTLAIHALDYELHPPGNPCREQPARHDVPKRVRNRTAAVVCLATWHANAAAKRARETTCAAAPPPPDPVRIFTLATTCAKGVAAFHSNG